MTNTLADQIADIRDTAEGVTGFTTHFVAMVTRPGASPTAIADAIERAIAASPECRALIHGAIAHRPPAKGATTDSEAAPATRERRKPA